MAKANSLTVGRYAWRPVINRWVIGRLVRSLAGGLSSSIIARGVPIPHSLFRKLSFSMQRQLYDRRVTTDTPSAWRERGGPLYSRSPRDPHF